VATTTRGGSSSTRCARSDPAALHDHRGFEGGSGRGSPR
jgi:hypothetical protein